MSKLRLFENIISYEKNWKKFVWSAKTGEYGKLLHWGPSSLRESAEHPPRRPWKANENPIGLRPRSRVINLYLRPICGLINDANRKYMYRCRWSLPKKHTVFVSNQQIFESVNDSPNFATLAQWLGIFLLLPLVYTSHHVADTQPRLHLPQRAQAICTEFYSLLTCYGKWLHGSIPNRLLCHVLQVSTRLGMNFFGNQMPKYQKYNLNNSKNGHACEWPRLTLITCIFLGCR